MLHLHARFFRLFLLFIILSDIVANHSADLVYHNITNHSDSQAYKLINQSPDQKGRNCT